MNLYNFFTPNANLASKRTNPRTDAATETYVYQIHVKFI